MNLCYIMIILFGPTGIGRNAYVQCDVTFAALLDLEILGTAILVAPCKRIRRVVPTLYMRLFIWIMTLLWPHKCFDREYRLLATTPDNAHVSGIALATRGRSRRRL